jgi:hypothetical protein
MGAFIGAFLVILTILYQSFTYDQTITKEVNLGKTDDLEIIQLINDLNNLNVIPSETQTKTVNFFQQNCNNNYSIILQCEKRYATDKEVVSNYENNILTQAEKDALWPPEQWTTFIG